MKLKCGNCGMEKVELKKPTPRHSRVAYCTTCGWFSTHITFALASEHNGWARNTIPPQWAKDAAKILKLPKYSWARL